MIKFLLWATFIGSAMGVYATKDPVINLRTFKVSHRTATKIAMVTAALSGAVIMAGVMK